MNVHMREDMSLHSMRADDGIAKGEELLKVDNISLSFGGVKAITDISFDIRKGEIRAIIGPNGAGKTSMLNVINGFYYPQEGVITFRGKRRRRARPQSAAVAQPRQPRAAVRASLTTRDQRAPARGRERPLTASASREARSTRARRVAMIQQHHDGCGDGASPEAKGWKDQADARAFDDADIDDMNMNAEDDTWFGGEEAALFQQFESRLPAS